MDGEQPEIDLAHIHWSSPELIYSLPNKSLSTADEALDYFVYSPFFDVRSNNQVLRVQRRVTGVEYGHAQEKIDLLTFRSGFEFIISHSSPPSLFVVQKRNVEIQTGNPPGARSTNVLGQWFILDGKIYPCPTVYDVMATRLKNASFLVSSTFKTLESSRPPSNPRTHSTWRSLPPSTESENPSVEKEDPEGPEEKSKRPTTEAIPNYPLLNALKSSRDSIQYLENLAQGPGKKVEPLEELRSVEDEIMGSSLPNAVGKGVESERSVKSLSLLPGLGNRSERGLGTPVSRLVSGKTPGLSVSSPLALQS